MEHQSLMSRRNKPDANDPNPTCTAEVQVYGGGFWDDISWTLYRCPACNVVIGAVGGGAHWWNYIVTNPRILETQARLVASGSRRAG
jgi:hypothetical protein